MLHQTGPSNSYLHLLSLQLLALPRGLAFFPRITSSSRTACGCFCQGGANLANRGLTVDSLAKPDSTNLKSHLLPELHPRLADKASFFCTVPAFCVHAAYCTAVGNSNFRMADQDFAAASSRAVEPQMLASAEAASGASAEAASAPSEDVAADDPLVQFVVVRRDLLKTLEWPTGSVIAQACHACTAVNWEWREDPDVQAYLSATDSMHKARDARLVNHTRHAGHENVSPFKVVKECKGEQQLRTLAEKLRAEELPFKLWIEQPENIPTAIALKPSRKSAVAPALKKYNLFK